MLNAKPKYCVQLEKVLGTRCRTLPLGSRSSVKRPVATAAASP